MSLLCRRCRLSIPSYAPLQSHARFVTLGYVSVDLINQLTPCCGMCTNAIVDKLKSGVRDVRTLLMITRGELRLLMRRRARR